VDISILLPAYNEASRIERSLREVGHAVETITESYEIVVIEDGSIDNTAEIVAELSTSIDHLRLLHSERRLGKGKAVKKGIASATSDIVVFMDVDLSANLKSLSKMVHLARTTNGLAVGSRHIKGSRVRRSFLRTISSLTYNLLVRLIFQDGVRDHQCGFKAMNRRVADFLRKNAKSEGFFLDTEMILLCKMHAIPVIEVAVDWTEVQKKKSQGVRLFKDATRIGFEMLRFRLTHLKSRLS
jgi:glycosyltransferase involved in cell wall biosynthesis